MASIDQNYAQMGDHKPATELGDGPAYDAWEHECTTGRIRFSTVGWYTVPIDFAIYERTLEEHICNFIVDGGLVVRVSNERRVVSPGSVVWIAPGVQHSFELAEPGRPFSMINTRFQLVSDDGQQHGFPERWLVAGQRHDLRSWFDMLVDDRVRRHPRREERARRIWYLLYSELTSVTPTDDGGLERGRRHALHAYLQRHVREQPTPADLAAAVGLSDDYFRRVFHRTFGVSPREWIVNERMRMAGERLLDQPHLSVAAVAEGVGYADPSTFSRQFRRCMGRSPRAWRQR